MLYEPIHTVIDWYDGIRAGTADLNGQPHYIVSLYDESDDPYDDRYRLYPVDSDFMQRALRHDAIFQAWDRRHRVGEVDEDSHPGHGGIDPEYDELGAWLAARIASLGALPELYHGRFYHDGHTSKVAWLPVVEMGETRRDVKSQSILARYAAGERIFADLDRDDGVYDFRNADLREAVFTGCFLFADFSDADLTGANFSESNVKTCNFSRAKLIGASFFDTAIDAAVFDGADLTGANFEEASEWGHVYGKGEYPLR